MTVARICAKCGATFKHTAPGRPPRRCPECGGARVSAIRRRETLKNSGTGSLALDSTAPEPAWVTALREEIRA